MTQAIIAVAAGLAGLAIGSFLNVVVHRVPKGMSLVRPPSQCPSCHTPVRPQHNIPVISYVVLRGRCPSCGERISARYPLIEALTAVLFVAAALRFERIEDVVLVAATAAVLVALTFIDLEHRRIPNVIVLPATAVAAVWVLAWGLVHWELSRTAVAVACGLAGFALLFVIAIVSGGMGFGDVKLAAFIGVTTGWFGWEAFILALFSGFVVGGVVGIGLLVTGVRKRKDAIPFAPMLCAGALIGLFAGPGPVRVWLGM